MGRDGSLFEWVKESPETGDATWKNQNRHYFQQDNAKVKSASLHAESGILAVGFSSGIFGLWELPDFTNLHTLR